MSTTVTDPGAPPAVGGAAPSPADASPTPSAAAPSSAPAAPTSSEWVGSDWQTNHPVTWFVNGGDLSTAPKQWQTVIINALPGYYANSAIHREAWSGLNISDTTNGAALAAGIIAKQKAGGVVPTTPSGNSATSGTSATSGGAGTIDLGTGAGTDPAASALLQQAYSKYSEMWDGQIPTQAYIQGLIDQGMNLFQMEQMWTQDPAFQKTQYFQKQAADTNEWVMSQLYGFSPGVGRRAEQVAAWTPNQASTAGPEIEAQRQAARDKFNNSKEKVGSLPGIPGAQSNTRGVTDGSAVPEGRSGKGPTK